MASSTDGPKITRVVKLDKAAFSEADEADILQAPKYLRTIV